MNQLASAPVEALEITTFWREAGPSRWFAADPVFDATIRTRFQQAVEAAQAGGFETWLAGAEGAFALILLLDQFSRNIFRGTPAAFAGDPRARSVAADAIARSFDRAVETGLRQFFYTPFMHSEQMADQDRSLALYTALHAEIGGDTLGYAEEHREIIRRFGRFPHRNPILGRAMTADEQAYLDGGGFRG